MLEHPWEQIIIVLLLLIAKGIVQTLSTSLAVLDLKKNKYIAEKDEKVAEQLQLILDKSDGYINACSVVNSLMSLLVGFVLAFRVFDTLVDILTARLSLFSAKWLAAAVILIVATYFFSIISVVLPKALANHSPDTIVLRMNKLAILLSLIARPMVWIVELSYKPINALIYGKNEPEEDISEEEILLMVDASGEQGSIDEHEKEMINNIFDFDDKTAGEIATHRKDIVALPIDATTDEIIDVVMSEKFSRIPVYEEDIDHIVGILHVKDFMHAVIAEGKDSFNMRSVLMEPLFVPYTKKTDELFAQMQGLKVHMVVVADEYGGTEGIVTMEDLIEEVMGEIQDEYDEEEEPEIEQVTEDVIKIDGTASLEDVAETLDIDMPTEEYDTLGGFLIGQLDRIPEEDEKDILVEYEGYSFNIDRVEDNRIVSVTVTRINSQI